jgi:hypothetical protein
VILSLGIFAGTFWAYIARHQIHAPGSYVPLAMGMSSFSGLMAFLNYSALPLQAVSSRLAKAVGIALIETIAFLVLLPLLLLNTIGS